MTLILSGTDGLSDVDGTAATPALRGTDANTGIFFGTDIIGFSEGGVESARFNASGVFTTTNDATISGLTVGKGANAVARNTAFGITALAAATGNFNTGIGNLALLTNSTGTSNTAVGDSALRLNTTGVSNTAIGQGAIESTTTGNNNSAIGKDAFSSNTTGSSNTALGKGALAANTTANDNTAVGYHAGVSNTTGTLNTFVGVLTGQANTTGSYNVAVGTLDGASRAALYTNTTGGFNNAVGNGALGSLTTANYNNGFGYQALKANTTGEGNTAVGHGAMEGSTTGNNNVTLGRVAGAGITTGSSNVLIGYAAGYFGGTQVATGSTNIHVGQSTIPSASSVNSELVMGNNITGKGTTTGFIAFTCYQGNNSASWSTTSDQRLKKNIVDNNTGLSAIAAIRVRNFEYRLPEEVTEVPQNQAIAKTGVQLGVIAQELQQVLPECVKTESTGVMTVDTDNLTWYLINAVKELTARVAQLEGN